VGMIETSRGWVCPKCLFDDMRALLFERMNWNG
jgi:hypothetical protein